MLLPNGKVLVAGGDNDETASAELYDSVSGTWTLTGSMKRPRTNHTATLLPNGKVLVVGGYNFLSGIRTQIALVELYDPATGTWTYTGSLRRTTWSCTGRHCCPTGDSARGRRLKS